MDPLIGKCDIDSIIKIIVAVFSFVMGAYEFICWLRRRPDDMPISPIQIGYAFVARMINRMSGSNIVADELTFRRSIQRRTAAKISVVDHNKFSGDSMRLKRFTHGHKKSRATV